jgi:hypothetical protein
VNRVTYDVFKGKPNNTRLWLGSIAGLERATGLMNRMAASLPGDYFVVDAATGELVALTERNPLLPLSGAAAPDRYLRRE